MYTFVKYLIRNTNNIHVDLVFVYLQLDTFIFRNTIVDTSTIINMTTLIKQLKNSFML